MSTERRIGLNSGGRRTCAKGIFSIDTMFRRTLDVMDAKDLGRITETGHERETKKNIIFVTSERKLCPRGSSRELLTVRHSAPLPFLSPPPTTRTSGYSLYYHYYYYYFYSHVGPWGLTPVTPISIISTLTTENQKVSSKLQFYHQTIVYAIKQKSMGLFQRTVKNSTIYGPQRLFKNY